MAPLHDCTTPMLFGIVVACSCWKMLKFGESNLTVHRLRWPQTANAWLYLWRIYRFHDDQPKSRSMRESTSFGIGDCVPFSPTAFMQSRVGMSSCQSCDRSGFYNAAPWCDEQRIRRVAPALCRIEGNPTIVEARRDHPAVVWCFPHTRGTAPAHPVRLALDAVAWPPWPHP